MSWLGRGKRSNERGAELEAGAEMEREGGSVSFEPLVG